VPAYAGIPVTHRGVAATFAVITGHEACPEPSRRDPGKGDPAIDWERLATAVDTLVLLMGVKTLPDVIEKLIAGGRPADTPVAVIRWGTTPDQSTVIGTLADIVRRVEEAKLEPPAITVVGEVVRLRETLRWFAETGGRLAEARPLFGKRVLITRTRRQASVMARLLADEGAVPVELPAIEIEPSFDDAAVGAALQALTAGAYAWAVFTSANAVELWFELMRKQALDARAFGGVRVAAIGPATADALAERGIVADAVPVEYVAEAVVGALAGSSPVIPSGDAGLVGEEAAPGTTPREAETRLPARPEALEGTSGATTPRIVLPRAGSAPEPPLRPGDRVLVPRAESARPELVEGLSALGAEVDEVTLYRAAVPQTAPAEALAALRDGGIDIVTFTSSSTVRNLAALLDGDVECLRKTVVACIGPITADTARELGLRVDVVAAEHTVPGLVAALRGAIHQIGVQGETHDKR
jgi:uroporphyrinogen III methyltransferase/synthase